MFSKNWRFSDVFREYRSGTLVENVLTVDTFLFFITVMNTQLAINFSKSIKETLEKCVKYIQT